MDSASAVFISLFSNAKSGGTFHFGTCRRFIIYALCNYALNISFSFLKKPLRFS